jgi:surface protein
MSAMFQSCKDIITIPLYDTSNVTNMNGMFNNAESLELLPLLNTTKVTDFSFFLFGARGIEVLPAMNWSNATNIGTFFNANNSIGKMLPTGMKVTFSVANQKLGKNELEFMLNNMSSPATQQTVTLTGNWGLDPSINRSCVLTQYSPNASNTSISTTGVSVGMFATGTGITTQQTVTVNSTTSRISHSVNSGWAPPDGTRVSVTVTNNGLTAWVIYYTRNLDAGGSFQVSLTPDGDIITLTNNINMIMNFENVVTGVTTNGVTFALPASVTGTQTISFRRINTSIARLKNWAVTG